MIFSQAYLIFLDYSKIYYFILTINFVCCFMNIGKSYNDFCFYFKGSICFDIMAVLMTSYRMLIKEIIRLFLYFSVPEIQYNNNCSSALSYWLSFFKWKKINFFKICFECIIYVYITIYNIHILCIIYREVYLKI